MKTIGVGVDIVKNKRIQSSLKNRNFIDRTFSRTEILISRKFKNRINYFSKRFAAKEAFAKALGTGFRQGLNFKDIQILNNKLGLLKLTFADHIWEGSVSPRKINSEPIAPSKRLNLVINNGIWKSYRK